MGKPIKDLKGFVYSNFVVEKYILFGKWKIKCLNCGKYREIATGDLNRRIENNVRIMCDCNRFGSKVIDLKGKTFGELTVLNEDPIYKNNAFYWNCRCSCGKIKLIRGSHLTDGDIKSCNHLLFETKGNKYVFKKNYIVGFTSNNKEFYFDLNDYDKIKNYTWYITSAGYVSSSTGDHILFHRLITNCSDYQIIDHIDRNPLNNRKNNLRITSMSENQHNRKTNKNNTSGISGVFETKSKKWNAKIMDNYVDIDLGTYDNFNDAVIARLTYEKEHFGKHASQRHLFKKYGV